LVVVAPASDCACLRIDCSFARNSLGAESASFCASFFAFSALSKVGSFAFLS